jgi:hypothetical protein
MGAKSELSRYFNWRSVKQVVFASLGDGRASRAYAEVVQSTYHREALWNPALAIKCQL